jgi:hypothetical protein
MMKRLRDIYEVIITTIAAIAAATTTSAGLKGKFEHDASSLTNILLHATIANIGKGQAFNNNLIDDPGAIISKIAATARLDSPTTKQGLHLLADQGLITIKVIEKKRAPKRNKKLPNNKRLTVTTVKVTDNGYKHLQQ